MKNSEPIAPSSGPEDRTTPQGISPAQMRRLELQALLCRTMGHPIRLHLLHHLHRQGGEIGSSELAKVAGIPRASLSQHLAKMSAAGLVRTRRSGKYVFVSLARESIGSACELVSESLERELQERAALMSGEEDGEA